jgi:CRISPR-associated endonuclease/helicase Cas3
MYQAFRRVSYVDEGELSDDALVAQLSEKSQVLCVVNSRKQAQKLYQCLEGDGNYHLSTMMIPQDRKRVLRAIRERLKAGKACRVISTSLVEAGVDLDFPEVYRALAGLDSIIQAGGRCNREGKRLPEESLVHIFRSEAKPPQMLEQNISAARRTLRNHTQVDSPEAVHNYFSFLLYTLRGEERLDEKNILPDAEKLRFQTVSRAFHLIDGADYTVYVPIDEGADLIRRLRREGLSRSLLRALGQFSVGVYRQYFERLRDAGALELVSDNAGILADLNLYSRETGLPFEISEQNQGIFI